MHATTARGHGYPGAWSAAGARAYWALIAQAVVVIGPRPWSAASMLHALLRISQDLVAVRVLAAATLDTVFTSFVNRPETLCLP